METAMLGVQVLLLLVVRVRVVTVGTVTLGDLLLRLLLRIQVQVVGTIMKAAAGTQTLDEKVLVRIRKTGTARTGMHHHVLVLV